MPLESALQGIRVIELGEGISGPYCAKILASFGAEVIKVEKPPEGDISRKMGPFPGDHPHPEKSGTFLYLNTGKKSITLDYTTTTGCRILKDLVKTSDILVENFPPGVISSLGLEYETLESLNPGLVITSITGYGQNGPYHNYRTSSITGYALSGHQYINGEPDREPLQGPGPQPEYQGGLYGFFGTLTALYSRTDSGVGQRVDVSIMECMSGIHQFTIIRYTYGEEIKRRTGNRYEFTYPVTIYPCKNGYVALSASSSQQQELLYSLVGMPELIGDPRFVNPLNYLENADILDSILQPWFEERTKEEIFHACEEWRVPCAPVTSPDDLLEDTHLKEREFWVMLDHPEAGSLVYPGAPFRMSGTPWQTGRAPLLGEHNEEVYCQALGYTREELIRLRENGVV